MSEMTVRYTDNDDAFYLKEWLEEPGVLRWFPMANQVEVDDAIKHWISFSKFRCSLTALCDGIPCGMATLYLMPYQKVAHQCLFSIIVDKDHRGQGVGTLLLNNLISLAKEQFKIEYLYLEVYEGNPAVGLYRKFGFEEVGAQPHFIKEDGKYFSKVIMERKL